jgi:hypothetical protein
LKTTVINDWRKQKAGQGQGMAYCDNNNKKNSSLAIDVNVRLRPIFAGDESALDVTSSGINVVGDSSRKFNGFASCIIQGSDQQISHSALGGKLLTRFKEGYSCTLLAYGQTGI